MTVMHISEVLTEYLTHLETLTYGATTNDHHAPFPYGDHRTPHFGDPESPLVGGGVGA